MFKAARTLKCANDSCNKNFVITQQEIDLRSKFDVQSLPKICPDCRHQDKLAFCGYVNFSKRNSDKSGKPIITVFSDENKFPVYSIQEWWSDDHDPRNFKIDFDPNKDFFTQFYELSCKVPRMANSVMNCENSDYANYVGNSKNVYFSSIVYGNCEDIYYSYSITDKCREISDCLRVYKSSYDIECVQCSNVHYSANLLSCVNCRDSFYCYNLIGCNDCIFSSGLRNQQYYAFNKKHTKEEFQELKAKYINGSFVQHQKNLQLFYKIISNSPTNSNSQISTENCYGSGLLTSANSYNCFHCVNCVDSINCLDVGAVTKMNSCLDATNCGSSELLFNCMRCGSHNYFLRNCISCRASSNLDYCLDCVQSKDCFACVGLKNAQYCIFNVQYSENNYNILKSKLIEKLKSLNIWGEFFPKKLSQFEYNNSMAMIWYPLSEQVALESGYRWEKVKYNSAEYTSTDTILDNIKDIQDDICRNIYFNNGSKPFKYVKEEIKLFQSLGMPLLRDAPIDRMLQKRYFLESPEFYQSKCSKCEKDIKHSFSDLIPRKIYCPECYNSAIY